MTDQPIAPTPPFPPASDRLRRAETETALMKRLGVVNESRVGELLALAQEAIGRFQGPGIPARIIETHDEQAASDLIAASRMTYDLAASPSAELAPDARLRLSLLAACAYAMQGNFPSAAATIATLDRTLPRSAIEAATIAIADPSQPLDIAMPPVSGPARDFVLAVRQYLLSGRQADANAAWALLKPFVLSATTVWEGVLARCCRTILSQQIVLATAQLLQPQWGAVFNAYIQNLVSERRYTLLPPQRDLIWRQGLLGSLSNALVTLPTSTGKTLLAELAIARSLEDPDAVAIFVAPYIALGRQAFESLERRAPDYIEVRGHFGTFNSDFRPIAPGQRTILVVTPERLDGLLRSDPTLFGRLRTVVFDEAHGLENGTRGLRLEGLITRLKLQQARHPKIRLMLLSAVLTNGEDVRRWLGANAVHYDHSWRPTARRIAFWFSAGVLSWRYGNDPLRPSDKSTLDEVGAIQLPWPAAQSPTDRPGLVEQQKPGSFLNVSALAFHLHRRDPSPILIACATKGSTRGVAKALSAESLPRTTSPPAVAALLTLIEASHTHLKPLAEMLRRGVAYHNASLPSDVKQGLEEAIKARELDFVSATTTLAEGVDMPFRHTIVFEWMVGVKDKQAPMSPLMFRNIAGRCGRAGAFVEGDTVVYENVLGNLTYTAEGVRGHALATLLSDPPALVSAANDNVDATAREAIEATLSAQLIASIPENRTVDQLDQVFAATTYAAAQGTPPAAMMARIRAELLDDQFGEPLARAASPMYLTPLGEAANRTGFSAKTVRLMLAFLAEVQPAEPQELAAQILLYFGTISEQSNYLLKAIAAGDRTQFYVKAADMELLATRWLTSASYMDIFLALPRARSSQAQVTPAQWAAGVDYERTAAQYDKLVDLLDYAFGNYLLWLLRALEELSPYVSRTTPVPDWKTLADQYIVARQIDDAAQDQALGADGSESAD